MAVVAQCTDYVQTFKKSCCRLRFSMCAVGVSQMQGHDDHKGCTILCALNASPADRRGFKIPQKNRRKSFQRKSACVRSANSAGKR